MNKACHARCYISGYVILSDDLGQITTLCMPSVQRWLFNEALVRLLLKELSDAWRFVKHSVLNVDAQGILLDLDFLPLSWQQVHILCFPVV